MISEREMNHQLKARAKNYDICPVFNEKSSEKCQLWKKGGHFFCVRPKKIKKNR